MDLPANRAIRALLILAAGALTAGAYFASTGLHTVWWLPWLAPLPVLLLAPELRAWQAFAVALAARAVGVLNIWIYMRQIGDFPLWRAGAMVLGPAIYFALAVVLYRGLFRKGRLWLAALAFPVTMVAGEYLFSLFLGTFLNTGYTQLQNLPLLQLAALTGLWGISFSVNLFPAALAALVRVPAKLRMRMAVAVAAFYVCVFCYGLLRLHGTPQSPTSVLVGFVETHGGRNMMPHDPQTTMALMQQYAAQVQPLAARGAQFVILPEMTAVVPDSVSPKIDALFQQTARDAQVQVLLGVLHVTDHGAFNEARLYSAAGAIETVYRKHHLVPTWEKHSTPGNAMAVLPQPEGKIGIQICYDMDFPEWSRRYAQQQVDLMLVPAWDQGMNIDAAWHGHLSLMRGVEGGFTLVRDAKDGLLTASDDRGRILAEEPSRTDGAVVTLLAAVPVRHDATLYEKWGDWFAWADLAALALFLCLPSGLFLRHEPELQPGSNH
jgi:apolipoprotein N-acyltransferase